MVILVAQNESLRAVQVGSKTLGLDTSRDVVCYVASRPFSMQLLAHIPLTGEQAQNGKQSCALLCFGLFSIFIFIM